MDIYVPWLDTHITGDGHLQSGGGKQPRSRFLQPRIGDQDLRQHLLYRKESYITQVQGHGWAVQTSTTYTFNSEGKTFATIPLTPFIFGMDGRAYLANGATSIDVSLGGSSTLGPTPVDLVSAHINSPISGSQIFSAQFSTHVHLSEVMAAAPMQVNYEMTNREPTSPRRARKLAVHRRCAVSLGPAELRRQDSPRLYDAGGGTTEYSGTVDLSELGGPPVTAQFRLGYGNGHDYWLTRAIIGLGDDGNSDCRCLFR